jgi:hypothetical protein
MLLLVQSYAPDMAPYINLEQSPSQLASTFGSWFFLLLVRLNLGFVLRKDLPLCSSYLPLGVPNWAASTAIMLTYCMGKRGTVYTTVFIPLSQMFVANLLNFYSMNAIIISSDYYL